MVSDSPNNVQLDNIMSLDALKKAIENKISLPNGKVVNDIHFLCPISFVANCFQYMACILLDDENIVTVFSIFGQHSNHTCLVSYHRRHTHTNMCTNTTNSWMLLEFGGFGWIPQWSNELESGFEESSLPPSPQIIWLLLYYLMICSRHVCCSFLYY